MKDATTCDNPRRAGSKLWPEGLRMGKPDARYGAPPDRPIHNRQETTLGIETSKYQEEKKENSIPSVAASESGRA